MFLLADINIQGHIEIMVKRMQAKPWIELWNHLELSCVSFADLGLSLSDSDAVIWRCCQQRQVFLLTNNRNNDGPESLETTSRECSTPQSLPVFTIGDAERLRHDQQYSDRAIEKLFRYLLEIDNVLGTGRLFLP